MLALETESRNAIVSSDLDEVDLVETFIAARLLDVKDRNDVLVIEVSQQLHLAQSAQTEHRVIKRRNLLDRNFLAGWLVDGGAEIGELHSKTSISRKTYQTTP